MTEYVKKSEVLDTLWKADGITYHGIEVLNHMPAEDVIERPKNVEALLEIACDLCKYPSEYKDQDDLIHEHCDHCPMFEKLMEVAGE